ncbi:MAG TPA: hypothetical protein VFQ05_04890 [Candidatus Eisenbacteria bacterium]|nr:hypothetical protein [Candidatus Eisenbacteria bacterium]
MDDSRDVLGNEPTRLLLEDAEAGRRQLAASEVERLDRAALLSFLAARGIPPGGWPEWIEIRPVLKAELWMRILESAKKGWAALATLAVDDLGPDGERWEPALDVARTGIETAKTRGGTPLDWQELASRPAYPELRPLLTQWARENVVRMRGDWETAYFILGDDPGGTALARANVLGPVAGRLVMRMCEALPGPHGERAAAWLDALATSPLRDVVPLEIKLDLPAVSASWAALARLRDTYDGTSPSAETAPLEQRRFLDRELKALTQRDPARSPDVVALMAQLGGEMSETTLKALSKWTKPSRPEGAAAGAAWLTGIAAAAREQTGKLARLGAKAAIEQTGKLAELGVKAAREQTGKLAEFGARAAREQAAKLSRPKPKGKAKPKPEPELELEPAPAETIAPVIAGAEPTELQKNLLEWVRGGSAEDDRLADEAMVRLFEEGTEEERQQAQQAIAGFGDGMLYRLAARAALNPRLLDGVGRVVDETTLDAILLDVVQYDLWGFAPKAAERLSQSSRDGSYGPVDQAVIRLLRDGPAEAREALAKHLGSIDRTLLGELLGPDLKAG